MGIDPPYILVRFECCLNDIETAEVLSYLFIVIEKTDLPISIAEHKFVNMKFIGRNDYTPIKCE